LANSSRSYDDDDENKMVPFFHSQCTFAMPWGVDDLVIL